MHSTSNAFGGLAFAILAVFALWTSTLATPAVSAEIAAITEGQNAA